MTTLLAHRGPDGSGVWADDEGVALGHRRLSILDLSTAGHQPMLSPGGRWVVSYNGEIFNHQALRVRLVASGFVFQGHSDTETLTVCLEAYGFAETLSLLVGMFAIAAWDRDEKRLYLARDRAGQKPLFYGFHKGDLIFGSECGILRALPSRPALDRESLALMLRYNSIPSPRTAYEGFNKLPPGTYLSFAFADWKLDEPQAYWAPSAVPAACGAEEARERTALLLEDSVRLRMLSDVPLGAFLSGGIDSSLIVSVMRKVSTGAVRTFTIDFDDARFSEAVQARAIAEHLGTDHTELKVTSADARALVPGLGALTDEPFGDSSLVPTLMLSELTRRSVTVALTGDGGDELFGGYHRQIWLPRIARVLGVVPSVLRRWLSGALASGRGRAAVLRLVEALRVPLRLPDQKLSKLAHLLLLGGDLGGLYRSSLSHVRSPQELFVDPVLGLVDEFAGVSPELSRFDQVCRADFRFYMPNDVLVKVDRASMRHSLEARSPFLDHRLVECAFCLCVEHKVRGGSGKMLLRSLLAEHLPAHLMSAPKMGFAVPIAAWLRGELRPWAEEMLASSWLRDGGLLRGDAVRAVWAEHLGGRDRHAELWNILMLLSWLEARRG